MNFPANNELPYLDSNSSEKYTTRLDGMFGPVSLAARLSVLHT